MADDLRRHPETDLTDLAFTLNSDLPPGGSRLALVAATAADAVTGLERALQRLEDPRCTQIRGAVRPVLHQRAAPSRREARLPVPGRGGPVPRDARGCPPGLPGGGVLLRRMRREEHARGRRRLVAHGGLPPARRCRARRARPRRGGAAPDRPRHDQRDDGRLGAASGAATAGAVARRRRRAQHGRAGGALGRRLRGNGRRRWPHAPPGPRDDGGDAATRRSRPRSGTCCSPSAPGARVSRN